MVPFKEKVCLCAQIFLAMIYSFKTSIVFLAIRSLTNEHLREAFAVDIEEILEEHGVDYESLRNTSPPSCKTCYLFTLIGLIILPLLEKNKTFISL